MSPQKTTKRAKSAKPAKRVTTRPVRKDRTRVLVLVGTRKGAFIFESDRARKKWAMTGPHMQGWGVNHITLDKRGGAPGVIFAAFNHEVYGANIHRSSDLGKTWQMADGPRFPTDANAGKKVARIWRVEPGHASRPDEVWAGVDPASLFKSEDGGQTWSPVDSLNEHATREKWVPGAGGLILHSIIPHPSDPKRMHVAISAAGVFRTEDGGATWSPKNHGTKACFLPEGQQWPEVGQCCHHLVMSPTNPEVFFQQNHCGVYRTENGGDEWTDIGEGLPAKFGFPMAIHSHEEQTIYIVPEVSDEYRYVPGGAMAVYRSRNGGRKWERLSRGLPNKDAYLHVFREGMATDTCDSCGVYVGTGTGQVFFSRNAGDSWEMLADFLPPIYSVATAVDG
ncbi:MAG: exo-alpha-sialidase [Chloroflexi bacterium]|nr:exo-alpha-sialidase [Chloroflexota bacterium]